MNEWPFSMKLLAAAFYRAEESWHRHLPFSFFSPSNHFVEQSGPNFWNMGDVHHCKRKRLFLYLLNLPVSFSSFLTPLFYFCWRCCELNKGYLKMFLIPPGARHVIIQEHEASPQILGKSNAPNTITCMKSEDAIKQLITFFLMLPLKPNEKHRL